MKYIESRHPPGLVGFITGGTPRFYEFTDALEISEAPLGSRMARAHSCNPVQNCNSLLYEMSPDLQWLWLLGDDHSWNPKLLMNLLDHDVDLVVPLVCRRFPPWLPVVYNRYVPAEDGKPHDRTRCYSWQELNDARQYDNGLLPIAAAGSAGMLVRRHVWEAIEKAHGFPWFRIGTTGPDSMAEDLDFTWKAAKMGFECVVDCNSFMDHLVTGHMRPHIDEETGQIAIGVWIYGRLTKIYASDKIESMDMVVRPAPRPEIII